MLLATLTLASMCAPGLSAAQLRVISANPPEAALHELADRFERETAYEVTVEALGTGALNRLLASEEPADVVIGTTASLDQAEESGQLIGPRTPVGRVGIGVIVRAGAAIPDVATAEALRRAALDADAVIYNTAGSGQYVERMFDALGIGDEVTAKSARPGNAAETVERVVEGRGREIGFGLISEMKPYEGQGIRIVGPLPEDLQNDVVFEGAVLRRSTSSDAARDFIGYVTTVAAREVFAAHGVD